MANRWRPAGVFLPVSAFPSRYGIGDFGQSILDFLDWLQAAGQRYWQILPLTIPNSVGSPYASSSLFAGNWMLISLEQLVQDGFLPKKFLPGGAISSSPVKYRQVAQAKATLLRQSFKWFLAHGQTSDHLAWQKFVNTEKSWLEDVAWFFALKHAFKQAPWWHWPKQWQTKKLAMKNDRSKYQHDYQFQTYLQWLFARQWRSVRQAAKQRGIQIIGDLPFYPILDSVEVWSRPELFLLDRRHRPMAVAGVPPDMYSRTGQRWGNPVYHWSAHRAERWRWWSERLRQARRHVDLIRLDHFRGLTATWHIPASHPNGVRGHWVPSPGAELLRHWHLQSHPHLIAEDLGLHSPAVDVLRERWRITATRVWQFAWSGLPDNFHYPTEVIANSVYHTSTHDTDTVNGWWRHEAKWYERMHVREHLGPLSRDVHWAAIKDVYASRAQIAMVPVQDILGLGSTARFNHPGKTRGNWQWRLPASSLTKRLAKRLQRLAEAYA